MKRYLSAFWCAFICRYGYWFSFSFGSRCVGHSSVFIWVCVSQLHTIRCYIGLDSIFNWPWIGVRSADICHIYNRFKTDKPSTNGGQIKTDTSLNTPRQNWHYTWPITDSQSDSLLVRDISTMFERFLTNICVCPNINPKPKLTKPKRYWSQPIFLWIWWFFLVWGRFLVGLASVMKYYRCFMT